MALVTNTIFLRQKYTVCFIYTLLWDDKMYIQAILLPLRLIETLQAT